jgi:N-acetylglucosaminyl-diphospho-decaprenol L-rhamnosyltransferase
MDHDLSIVIVSWNVRELLRQCLVSIVESLSTGRGGRLSTQLIVVDNASGDGSAKMVATEFPQVELVANERNLGFTQANNQGIAISDGRYVLLLNPDTETVGDALAEMVAHMENDSQVGALGPKLLNGDGRVQSSRRRFPGFGTAFLEGTFLQQWFPNSPVLERYYVLDRAGDEIQEVDWVVGACLLMRRTALDQVGPLDEMFFMYSEEMDWCYRVKERGWKVVYLPTAEVIHHEGKSSEQVLPVKHVQFQRSKVLFFKKHFGGWRVEVLRLYLLAIYLWQAALESLKWLLGHKRTLRRQRVAAYWQVLRSGLE